MKALQAVESHGMPLRTRRHRMRGPWPQASQVWIDGHRIDGASEWRIFLTIIVPVLTPVLATLAIFSFLASWNDFMWPLIVLTDDTRHTLPVALAGLSREHVQDNELMMAGSVVTILPVLVVFLALQRHYMAGLMAGSVKG